MLLGPCVYTLLYIRGAGDAPHRFSYKAINWDKIKHFLHYSQKDCILFSYYPPFLD